MGDTPSLIDWDTAVSTARRLAKPGPQIGAVEAASVVAELRALGAQAEHHVRRATGLSSDTPPEPATVVDRPGWVRNNVEGFRVVLSPLLSRMADRRSAAAQTPLLAAVGSRATGVQLGTVLAFLSSRVLGQYEIFLPRDVGTGRLTLVAPNIVATERALDVDPHDFRLWVCLHEVTHRTQFTAVPWLRGFVTEEVSSFLLAADLDAEEMRTRLSAALRAVTDAALGREGVSLLSAVQSPEQRIAFERLSALMTLVEGHAEYVMDVVGPEVVPSVATIRRRFDDRRAGGGALDRVLRRLFGLDVKTKQYAEGKRFVRAVVDNVGMDGFNAVWTSPDTLPTSAEIAEPAEWVDRVLGERPAVPA